MYSHEEKNKGGFTIGSKNARDDSTIGPGPGGYEQNSTVIKSSEYTHKIGTSQRTKIVNERES